MRKSIFLVALLGTLGFLSAQDLQPQEASQPSGHTTKGHTAKLLDFNLLSQGDRLENPFHTENWVLSLDGPIDYRYNRKLTYTKVAKDKSGNASIGVRINFPRVFVDAQAILKPVFNVPFLSDFKEKGFIDNVGTIKSIKMKIRSNVYPYRVYLNLSHKDGSLTKHRFNRKLDFYDWQTIEWENPYYEEDFRYDASQKKKPLYPLIIPGVRIDSFVFERDRSVKFQSSYDERGNDFVIYISDVSFEYDKAVNDDYFFSEENKNKPDYIDNETMWQIEASRKKVFNDEFIKKIFENYKLDLQFQRARKLGDGAPNANQIDGGSQTTQQTDDNTGETDETSGTSSP